MSYYTYAGKAAFFLSIVIRENSLHSRGRQLRAMAATSFPAPELGPKANGEVVRTSRDGRR